MSCINVVRRAAYVLLLIAAETLAHGAEPGSSADELLEAGGRALQQIDQSQYALVWQDAAPFVKERFTQDSLGDGLARSRQPLGQVSHRGWSSVTRLMFSHSPKVPDGSYANIEYTTALADGRVTHELLSLNLGSDGRWHFVGYVPLQTTGIGVSSQGDRP